MVQIKRFSAIRPINELASRVAALPYDVYNTEEARVEIEKEPYSFLKVDSPIATLPVGTDEKSQEVYKRAKENFDEMKENSLVKDIKSNLYLYELTFEGRSQLGLVCCTAIDEYLDGTIKKHEKTRQSKEEDRIKHIDVLDANTGPIFLTYEDSEEINSILEAIQNTEPEINFKSADNVIHRVWTIDEEETIQKLETEFKNIENLYIADGHHRVASAARVAEMRRRETPNYNGEEEFNFFMSILYPKSQVKIYDYNRVVKDLNGLSAEEFIAEIEKDFDVEFVDGEFAPNQKSEFGMYLENNWYRLNLKNQKANTSVIENLDVSILQNNILEKILGIKDPRTDDRIDFIGGVRGLKELERRVHEDMKVAFALYPTSLEELMTVADLGEVMPPKSTWFEPKPRSGLFIHELK
ncbi:Uncharacterized conserved protein, DUF1015 family [Peptoniphilus asaccharolyticus DSM 20463]|uniref:Uncharacterized conserved protein, DUF1015 family n=1 Tax=Peptoniphilus asaccharolyticus DSM 20463 TaxID=573058 RepID=A0A1W1UXU2_PEPAS|nr:DUF1015 family protein [Peptoniphilus asaccharolyticus]MBL7575327.1 DUF1015 domain-containing protein [Peptoniphilus asaccharolyticus]SMB85938.1 Uncharacterized conserved protein, DUF1015 family [Peptoniphilus asaccharolyticus DSM 20463]